MMYSRRVSKKTRLEIYERDEGICRECECEVGKEYAIDHDLALALGGTNEPANLQLLCIPCHKLKTKYDSRRRSRRPRKLIDDALLRGEVQEAKPKPRSKWGSRELKSRNNLRKEK